MNNFNFNCIKMVVSYHIISSSFNELFVEWTSFGFVQSKTIILYIYIHRYTTYHEFCYWVTVLWCNNDIRSHLYIPMSCFSTFNQWSKKSLTVFFINMYIIYLRSINICETFNSSTLVLIYIMIFTAYLVYLEYSIFWHVFNFAHIIIMVRLHNVNTE